MTEFLRIKVLKCSTSFLIPDSYYTYKEYVILYLQYVTDLHGCGACTAQ